MAEVKEGDYLMNVEYKGDMYLHCVDCHHFFNVNIGGNIYNWCFNTTYNGLIESIDFANNCLEYKEMISPIGVAPDEMSRNKKEQRNKKIKRKVQVFRYHYKLVNRVAYVISRYDYWIIVLSNNAEYLFHQNIREEGGLGGYENMMLNDNPEFHLHSTLPNSPLAIHNIFNIIDNHDKYVLDNRIHKGVNELTITPFDTPHKN